ncbi:MAG TPA: PIN domain-containing protein [Candidatus Thermoplasmatota archaeon]|nr:PIN domain-containing protein [Candidatus Thermoplasmatota archaeon]
MDAYVLDTSAILAGTPPSPSLGTLYIPEGVLGEIAIEGPTRRALDFLIEAGAKVVQAPAGALRQAREAAQATGDLPRMSEVDLTVLALGLERKATLLTDDYRIQNVARRLGIPFRAMAQRGITEERHHAWVYRCAGCKRVYPTARPDCDVCGSIVKQVRAR